MFSIFKSEFAKITGISFFIVFIIFAFSFIFFTFGFEPIYFEEENLEKNANFSILPGDLLVYEIKYGNQTEKIVFVFGRKILSSNITKILYDNCTLAMIQSTNFSTCINADGRNGETNYTLFPPVFFFFSPWMLAISENFTWKARVYNNINHELIQNFSATVLGTEKILGRNAYIVMVNESGIFDTRDKKVWIDKDYRILLKEQGKNYSVVLIRASLPYLFLQQAE